MSLGMTYDEYWYGEPERIHAYREADKLRRKRMNAEHHLLGMYIYEALCDVSPLLQAFAKKGTKPIPYRTEPYDLFAEEKTPQEKAVDERNDEAFARAYMMQLDMVGREWGKNRGN